MRVPRSNLERFVVGWLFGLGQGDLAPVRELLDPEIVWRGIREDLVCHGREEVLALLGEQLDDLPRPEVLEIVAGDEAVVMGVRSPDLGEVGGVPIPAQIFNVFRFRDGRIVGAQDYVRRADALRAAGASEPAWR